MPVARYGVVPIVRTQKNPLSHSRIFHVKGHAAYAVENSLSGIRLAILALFKWIDMDGHVTKDGVVVCGHWAYISKDHFDMPGWFRAKYGNNPRIDNVYAADLLKLRGRVRYLGKWYEIQYLTLGQAAHNVASLSPKLGIAFEPKGDSEFEYVSTWTRILEAIDRAKLPRDRFMVMTLQNIGNPWARMWAARNGGVKHVVLLSRGPSIPKDKKNTFPYVRGRMRWSK